MTDNTYGTYQTPSSRPPEPPYRSGSQEAPMIAPTQAGGSGTVSTGSSQPQPTYEPDLSGFGAATTVPAQAASADAAYAQEPTESFQGARFGDTQSMPQDATAASAAPATRSATDPYAGRHSARPDYAETVRPAAPAGSGSTAAAKKSGGAGKTFLFGFLGALVACAIAFGAFSVWSGNGNMGSASAGASTTLGATDSSVINAVDEGQTLAEAVAAKALPSVVAVYNYQQQTSGYGFGYSTGSSDSLSASGMGSGVVISNDGYILTNYHVVEDASKITVKVGDSERDATYVGGDSSSDVAVVKVDDTEGLVAADIGDSDNLVIGEWVMTVGAPLGLEQSVATGVVSATNRSTIMSDSDSASIFTTGSTDYTYYPNMIQTDAVINPGNSGGALVDADGKLIGINTMISSYSGDYAGVGFAIPVNYAMGIAEDIIDGKEPTHAMLGVSISSVNASNAQRYGLSSTSGAYIASIAEGTGAADSDLQVGDIITAIDSKSIASTTDVTLDVREHQPGDVVTVTVNRNGETKDIEVVLSSDENMSTGQGNSSGDQNNQNNRNGNGSGGSGSNGYNMEQLEELLKMLGM